MWLLFEFYLSTDIDNINLPTDVAKLVVQQVRDRDIGRSELASYLDHYAIFAEAVLDAVL